jgi:hypothetical protein
MLYKIHPAPTYYSINQIVDTKPIASKNIMNFCHLYLEILNSSTITSIVAMYTNVPVEIDSNIPVMRNP